MLKIKKQISGLYLSSILGNLSLTGAWVAILAVRGYSLTEIGFAETVFHLTSIIFEIPSGVLADLFGRRRMLVVSSVLRMIGNIIMIFSRNLFMVCASLAFHAMSYNFSSGSGDALAYDSLKLVSKESYYEKYASNQLTIYRLCSGISTLCAGFALFIGYKAAYSTDILLLFFLQAKLPAAGIPGWALGFALFFMEMGGILGARVILKLKKLSYRSVFMITAAFVLWGVVMEHSNRYVIMALGGFIAALGDDALQVRTNTILQDMFPSEQRATLISMESFTFSIIMIVLSPLAGILFSNW